MMKSVLVFAAIATMAAPALADEYYVVRGPDRECRVVDSRPADTTIVQIGPLAFKTRDDAERERIILCKDENGDKVIIKQRD
jgi:hypothetical protein